ncbi:MAG: HD domain-containing protein [Phycisphaerae bacterium]
MLMTTQRLPTLTTNGQKNTPQPLRLAAIDVGSNSIHMIVAQIDPDGAVTNLWRMKEPVGLGRGSFNSNRLSREMIERVVSVLARFKRAAIQRGAEKISAVATSAVREAVNGGELIERVKQECKLWVKIVNAPEEARLIYLGVRHAMHLGMEPNLIIDIGGGSVEFCVANEEQALLLESRKLGAARLTARFVKSDPISQPNLAALRKHIDKQIEKVVRDIAQARPVRAVGTSGTLENVAAMCGAIDESGGRVIRRETFQKLHTQLLMSNSEARSRMAGLDEARRDQIVAAAVLIGELFEKLPMNEIVLCNAALREGIVIDYLQRHVPDLAVRREVPDPRRRSVIDLARRCNWHKTHSEQVTYLALRLFDELRGLHGLGGGERELLEYAALLHDIGWHIAKKSHHKHSQYLIENGELKAFEPEEVAVIANIARYHRKGLPKPKHQAYMSLKPPARRVVDVCAAVLRIADGLDRSHDNLIEDLRVTDEPKRVKVDLTARSDAQLEVWGANQKADLFATVFGKPAFFHVSRKRRR